MSELGRYLATYYLPHIEHAVLDMYEVLVRRRTFAGHMTRMHAHMWKMALTDDACDLHKIRTSLMKLGASGSDLEAIDDVVVSQLSRLIASHGADRQNALHTEVAMALAAMNVTSVMSSAA
jgi:hypothetical protein